MVGVKYCRLYTNVILTHAVRHLFAIHVCKHPKPCEDCMHEADCHQTSTHWLELLSRPYPRTKHKVDRMIVVDNYAGDGTVTVITEGNATSTTSPNRLSFLWSFTCMWCSPGLLAIFS